MAPPTPPNFPTIDQCPSGGLAASTIISDLDGSLLRGRNSFPYFALTAFETGGPVRLLLLIVISPLAAFLYHFVSESAGIQVLIFASLAGAKISSIESAAKAVLPKFYMEDLHPETWRVLSASGRRCVVTENPTVMVEPFLKEYLGVDLVLGTELNALRGRATGFVRRPGVLVGEKKAAEVKRLFGDATPSPEIGIGGRPSNFAFMKLCKAAYIVRPGSTNVRTDEAEGEQAQPKPVIFHDGRLVQRPTVLVSLLTLLWLPAGFLLSCVRVAASSLLPIRLAPYYFRLLGIRLSVSGSPPPVSSCKKGSLYISSHRTLLDPFIISVALGRPISTVTYSLSPFSELISPIRTIRLTRNRSDDASAICQLLREDDVVICPEGTTCREPYLLRFSALFAELANEIVPVAAESRTSMFHGTTARGWKWMDPFYFFMNPVPAYHITFLGRLPREMTCAGGKTSFEVANYVQRIIAATLCFQCTDHTRKDKYMALAKNDGTVPKNKTKTRSMIK